MPSRVGIYVVSLNQPVFTAPRTANSRATTWSASRQRLHAVGGRHEAAVPTRLQPNRTHLTRQPLWH